MHLQQQCEDLQSTRSVTRLPTAFSGRILSKNRPKSVIGIDKAHVLLVIGQKKWSMPGIDFGQLLNQTLPMSLPPFFLFTAHLFTSVKPICILSQKGRKDEVCRDAHFLLLFLQGEVSSKEAVRTFKVQDKRC